MSSSSTVNKSSLQGLSSAVISVFTFDPLREGTISSRDWACSPFLEALHIYVHSQNFNQIPQPQLSIDTRHIFAWLPAYDAPEADTWRATLPLSLPPLPRPLWELFIERAECPVPC